MTRRKIDRDKIHHYRKRNPDAHQLAHKYIKEAVRSSQATQQKTSSLRGLEGNAAFRLASAASMLCLATSLALDEPINSTHWRYIEEKLARAEKDIHTARQYASAAIARQNRRNGK